MEIAGLIDAIERNAEYGGYHGSQKQIVKFTFKPYIKDDKQLGFSFSVNREDKEDSTDKQNYLIGFYYPEAMRLKIYLQTILSESYKVDYAPQKSSQAKPSKQNADDYDF